MLRFTFTFKKASLIQPLLLIYITEKPTNCRRHSNEKRERSAFEAAATAAPTGGDNHDDHDGDDGYNNRDCYHINVKRIECLEKNSSMAIMKQKIMDGVRWTHYLPTGLDNLSATTAHTNTRL